MPRGTCKDSAPGTCISISIGLAAAMSMSLMNPFQILISLAVEATGGGGSRAVINIRVNRKSTAPIFLNHRVLQSNWSLEQHSIPCGAPVQKLRFAVDVGLRIYARSLTTVEAVCVDRSIKPAARDQT